MYTYIKIRRYKASVFTPVHVFLLFLVFLFLCFRLENARARVLAGRGIGPPRAFDKTGSPFTFPRKIVYMRVSTVAVLSDTSRQECRDRKGTGIKKRSYGFVVVLFL